MQLSIPAALTEWMGPPPPPQRQRWGAGEWAGGPVIPRLQSKRKLRPGRLGTGCRAQILSCEGGWEGRGAQSPESDAEGRGAEMKPVLVVGAPGLGVWGQSRLGRDAGS